MPRQPTMEDIFLLKCLMEKRRESCKDFHMNFINLEKAYDWVPRDATWWVLERNKFL